MFRWIPGFSQRIRQACALLLLLLPGSVSYAQTCALCYTQAASAGDRIMEGLRSGILVLVIPPMLMSVGITVLAYRKRNRCGGPTSSDGARSDW